MKLNLALSCLILSSCLYADSVIKESDGNKKTNNEVDDGYSVEKGWSFYEDGQNPKTLKKDNKLLKGSIIKLLTQIKDENKKQTKIQQAILKILQKTLDPQPKMITLPNGEQCVANSSAECFDYESLMIPEARKVPAMKEFLADPYDLNKAANYLQWQSKLFNHSFNIGNSLQFASEQWGDKANILGTTRPTYDTTSGFFTARVLPKAEKKYINSLNKEFIVHIFLGINTKLDIFALSNIAEILRDFDKLKYHFHFTDQKTNQLFSNGFKTLYGKKNIAWNKALKNNNKTEFRKFGIITSPSIVLQYIGKKDVKNKIQTIITGRTTINAFKQRFMNYLEFNKIKDYKKLSDYRIWEENSDNFTKKYYETNYHIKLDTTIKK